MDLGPSLELGRLSLGPSNATRRRRDSSSRRRRSLTSHDLRETRGLYAASSISPGSAPPAGRFTLIGLHAGPAWSLPLRQNAVIHAVSPVSLGGNGRATRVRVTLAEKPHCSSAAGAVGPRCVKIVAPVTFTGLPRTDSSCWSWT